MNRQKYLEISASVFPFHIFNIQPKQMLHRHVGGVTAMCPFTLLKHHSGKGWVDVTVWASFFFSDSLSSFSFRATTLAAGRGFEKGGLCWAAALKNLCSANSTEFMSKGCKQSREKQKTILPILYLVKRSHTQTNDLIS